MIYTLDQIKEIAAPVAKEYGIETMYLFGSYARGEAQEDSDLDFLIKGISKEKKAKYPSLFVNLEERFEKSIDIVTEDSINADYAFNDMLSKSFKDNLNKERIVIYEQQGY